MKFRYQMLAFFVAMVLLATALTNWFVTFVIVVVGIIAGLYIANWRLRRKFDHK